MIHEFEYKIEWLDEDGRVLRKEIYVTQVDDDGLEDYEVEELARDDADSYARECSVGFDWEITLVDAR